MKNMKKSDMREPEVEKMTSKKSAESKVENKPTRDPFGKTKKKLKRVVTTSDIFVSWFCNFENPRKYTLQYLI